MKKTKIFAVVMAAVMVLSMAACGGKQSSEPTPTPTPVPTPTLIPATPTPEAEPTPAQPEKVEIQGASINFEDGKMDFVKAYMQHATSAETEISVVDFNGSKMLKVVNVGKKVPFLALDVSSLLGDNIAKVAGVEMVMGISYEDGSFYAVSGEILSWYGQDLKEQKLGDWSVYMEKKNPKIVKVNVPAGNEFVAGAGNIMLINLKTDTGMQKTGEPAAFYLDDIRFFDAAGNTIAADTSVAFVEPDGFSGGGADYSNLYLVENPIIFEGFATSAGAWGQNGFDIPQEIRDALVPGSVLEISYSSEDGSMWIVMPDSAAGWMRVGNGENGTSYKNNSGTVAQITYEQIAQFCTEDTSTWGARLQCEAASAWEVYSVKVGTAANRFCAVNSVEFEGFATSAGAWGQNGFDMTPEVLAALVPGSVVEIDYSSEDGSMWIVMPDSAAGWMRVGDGTNGQAFCQDGKCYVTYEQIAQFCTEDTSTWGARMQCEAKSAWEVYGLRVGTKADFPALNSFVNFEGFATSGGGWGQNGFEMTPEVLAALVPGSVVEISYTSEDGTMWIVMPDSAAGWMRVGDGTNGQALCENGKCYITYEQLAQFCTEDTSTWGARMQCEAKTAWEVYSVRIGQAK